MVRKPARNSLTTLLCAMPLRRNDPTIHARLMGSIGRNWMKIFRTKASSHINTPFFTITFFIFRAYLREIIEPIGAKNLTPRLRICPLFGAVSPNNPLRSAFPFLYPPRLADWKCRLVSSSLPSVVKSEVAFPPQKPLQKVYYI